MNLRQEHFLFDLPFDAGAHRGFAQHVKDDRHGTREPEWADFDLQGHLGLDSPPAEGSMVSTTLMFSIGEIRTDPFRFLLKAWPGVMAQQRKAQPWPGRLMSLRPALYLYRRFSKDAFKVRHTVAQAVRIAPLPESLTDDWRREQMGLLTIWW